MKYVIITLALSVIVHSAQVVSAEPVTWHLRNVTFDDGSRAEGSFVFDAKLSDNRYSTINITTDAGVYGDSFFDQSAFLVVIPDGSLNDLEGEPVLYLDFDPALIEGEDAVNIAAVRSSEGVCTDFFCSEGEKRRFVTSGYAKASTKMKRRKKSKSSRKSKKSRKSSSKSKKSSSSSTSVRKG